MLTLWLFLAGLGWGSFLLVLAERLPAGKPIMWDRSKCDHCGKTLRWFELIPLLSFLMQSGRCRRCRKQISLWYPLVEVASGIGFAFGILFAHSPLLLVAWLILFSSYLVITVSDLKYQVIPDVMVVAAGIGALLWWQSLLINNILAGLGAASFLFLLWILTRGRGIGLGDVKLAFSMGLLLGFPRVVVALYASFLTGAIVGVILILLRRKNLKSRIAFGPFLIWGIVVSHFLNFWW